MNESLKDHSNELQERARQIRLTILDMIYSGGKGHIGGAFSATDLMVSIYYSGLFKISKRYSEDADRDKFILSKGHCATALYAILADKGYFGKEILASYGKDATLLGSHPDTNIPGVEISTGSLGMGLGVGAGMAYANKLDDRESKIIVLTGDGECYEGSIWEAGMFAHHHKLKNLIWVIDRNGQCVLDKTENINELEPLEEKLVSFGFEVMTIDGHDMEAISGAFQSLLNSPKQVPKAIIAKTIKGKGVSFMENQLEWHHRVPNEKEYRQAKYELEQGGFHE